MSSGSPAQPGKQPDAWVCNAGCGKKLTGPLPFCKDPQCCGQKMRQPLNYNSWVTLECELKNNGCDYTVKVPHGKKEYRCQGRERLGNNKVCFGWMVPPFDNSKAPFNNNFI